MSTHVFCIRSDHATHVHCTSRHETSLDELVRVFAHDLAVLARAWLALVCVDDQISRLGVLIPAFGVHEAPLHARRETSTSSSS